MHHIDARTVLNTAAAAETSCAGQAESTATRSPDRLPSCGLPLEPLRLSCTGQVLRAPLPGTGAGRIVIASNRLPDPTEPAAGGLAVAVGELAREAEILWFGSSNRKDDNPAPGLRLLQFGSTTFAQVDLDRWQRDNYYAGFANSVLWPVFHEKPKYADPKPEFRCAYRQVNRRFASLLAPVLAPDDIVWVHDYHLIPLACELRALGCTQRMGFFSHVPLPPPRFIEKIPRHRDLMKSLLSYDLVGMQTARDVENLRGYMGRHGMGGAGSGLRLKAFPIGIDVGKLNGLVPTPRSRKVLDKVRGEAGRRRLMIGVDRLDYIKGIPKRLKAFRDFLKENPHMQGKVTLVQIAAPTREGVPAYDNLSSRTSELVDRINSEFASPDWQPVMYFNQTVEREALPALYRLSAACLVTSPADGMNLVGKEYVAAQAAEDPGVLVLSERAGAASQLGAAMLIPPQRAAIARACKDALELPLEDRQRMHAALLENVSTQDLSWWWRSYVDELRGPPDGGAHPVQPVGAAGRVATDSIRASPRPLDPSSSASPGDLDLPRAMVGSLPDQRQRIG